MAVAYLGLTRQQIAHSSVLTRITQQIGGSFGTAVLAVILEKAMAADGPGNLCAVFDTAFWWSVAFSGVAVLLSFTLPGKPRAEEVPAVGAVMTGQPGGRARRDRVGTP